MKILSIKIENLFEIFDYDIQFKEGENVLILTGANGFGKTQILNIIYHLFSRKFSFFEKLEFNKITISLEKGNSIIIEKLEDDIGFILQQESQQVEKFNFKEILNKKERHITRSTIIRGETLRGMLKARLNEENYREYFPKIDFNLDDYQKFEPIFSSVNVHLIREQRLLTKVRDFDDDEFEGHRAQTLMEETIKTYADQLKNLIEEKYEESLKITQQLDNSYPRRLISEENKISEDEYNKRFAELNTKQERLTKNGLYESKQEALEYSADDAKALLVYLDDLEKKLNVFDDLLEKLDLFTSILNERRFTYKTIHIDSEKGFYFKTSKDKELELGELSSGEQHEVVLLYELIFNTAPNNMVLIDEPEISLHVAWQKEFVKDLLKIIELQGFQVMMATHSPSIINDRWDLVHVLEKKEEA